MRAALKGRKGRFRSSSSSRTARVLSVERVMSASGLVFNVCVLLFIMCGLYFGWEVLLPPVKVCCGCRRG